MNHKLQSRILKSFVALIVTVALVIPTGVRAFGTADLLTATRNSEALCDSGNYGWTCAPARNYRQVLDTALAKPQSERDAYINSTLFNQQKTTTYMNIAVAYNNAVKDGSIAAATNDTSRISGDQSCPDGEVEVAISPSSNGDNCIGGTNPIYTYLRSIIFFMGGAIGLAVVITIIVAGIQYSSSAGNAANITQAKERLINAVIGLVLYLFLAAMLRYLVPQIFS